MKIVFLEEFGKAIIPERVRPRLRQYLLKTGITEVPYRTFGAMFYLFILLTIFLSFKYAYPFIVDTFSLWKIFLLFLAVIAIGSAIAILTFAIIYFYLDLRIFNRTKQMEEVLQEFLKFVSENLKGGMSFEKALWSAIKPEFGILASEVRLAAKKVMTGQDVDEAITEFTDKYDSPMLRRSFNLIIEGLKGGGRIAELIDRVIENIEETRMLKKDMAATNMTYVIFITFVVIVIAPGLFALSYQLLGILGNFVAKIGVTEVRGGITLPLTISTISIKPDDFVVFSRYALVLISAFSSMIVSMIRKGSIKAGVMYIPIFIALSLLMYSMFMFLLTRIFSSLISI
ncbi:MAG: type II secretion system F family protein [Nanoarchaeota archaeon]|nr:type II secretion system F family protein [Nanoarchaeota archaeon]